MIYTSTGRVAPPSGIVERLAQIDPGLGVLFGEKSRCWHITMDWGERDIRWKYVQNGSMPKERAYDILCQLPADCSADQAYGYIVRTFKAWSGSRDDIKRCLDRAYEYNKRQEVENMKPSTELAEELIETNAGSLFRNEGKTVPKFHQSQSLRNDRNDDPRKLRDYLEDTARAGTE